MNKSCLEAYIEICQQLPLSQKKIRPHRLQIQYQCKQEEGLVCPSRWYQLLFWFAAALNLKEV